MLETTYGGKELVDALVSIDRGVMPNVSVPGGPRPRRTGKCGQQGIEMLLDRGFGRYRRSS